MTDATTDIWTLTTDARFNRPIRPAPHYLTPLQAARWHRITQARMLYQGEHYRYYIEHHRSMYAFADVVIDGGQCKLFVKYNLLKRISDRAAAAEEVARIKKDAAEAAAAAMPDTLNGEPAAQLGEQTNTADAPSTEAA